MKKQFGMKITVVVKAETFEEANKIMEELLKDYEVAVEETEELEIEAEK